MGTLPLDVASEQVVMAIRDYQAAHAQAASIDPASAGLAMGMALTSLRQLQKSGWTEGGRRNLTTAIETLRAALGLESTA
jgi:hypothetical protein